VAEVVDKLVMGPMILDLYRWLGCPITAIWTGQLELVIIPKAILVEGFRGRAIQVVVATILAPLAVPLDDGGCQQVKGITGAIRLREELDCELVVQVAFRTS